MNPKLRKLWIGLSIFFFYLPLSVGQNIEIIDLNVSFFAKFLEPGVRSADESRGNEIQFGSLKWIDSRNGDIPTFIWFVPAHIHFKTQLNSTDIQEIRFIGLGGDGDKPTHWPLWRHRHGFIIDPQGLYRWAGLEDENPIIPDEIGRFYDKYLQELWSYWVLKRLPKVLKGQSNYLPRKSWDDDNPEHRFEQNIRMELADDRLHKPIQINYQLRLWNTPVKVFLTVSSSTTTAISTTEHHAHSNLITKTRWTYNRAEWRRRHGYEQNVWGDYQFDYAWPTNRSISEQQGKWLDQLLDQSITFWIDVSVQQIVSQIEQKLYLTRTGRHPNHLPNPVAPGNIP